MKSIEIRRKFFDFFKKHGHTLVNSSPLIPAQDPTLLFTNAGMNQFKDVFLGAETRSYNRAVSIQKCMRAGGKHNDLDNVGYTSRHLTFFEMMGNFSFGDYFKKDAIRFAWDFLTSELKLDQSKLYATVYEKDDEAFALWRDEIGLPETRIFRLGAKDNFWQMGDTGPCGPCSEILVDRGPSFGCGSSDCSPQCPCGERFLEVWNLVFMEFDRQPDGSDKKLKKPGVDTGMGLERIVSIVENKSSVYQTDLFMPIIRHAEKLLNLKYENQPLEVQAIFHVLADHTRAATFLIADGCSPSNDGRGYVLRKIIRRAALFAQKATKENILPQLATYVIEEMSAVYPELSQHLPAIVKLLSAEVQQFSTNLVQGRAFLEDYFEKNKQKKVIDGATAFKLYDTHGFPLELTRVMARERDFDLDEQGFEEQMERQRIQSGKKIAPTKMIELPKELQTSFTGYESLSEESTIKAIILNDTLVDQVPAGTNCWIIPTHSPFFVACGGQVADQGRINVQGIITPVLDLKKIDGAIAINIQTPAALHLGQKVLQEVDQELRWRTAKNHTATHLLQAALIELLGKQVRQAGSLVHPDYLRFDFTYCEPLTAEQIAWVEARVNRKIMENIPLHISTTTFKVAVERGVMAIFGEKYNPETVRVIDVSGFSAELCGGTHVRATGDIGPFKIIESSALSAGQRRIVALTGPAAVELFQQNFSAVEKLSQTFKVKPTHVVEAVEKAQDVCKQAELKLRQFKKKALQEQIPQLRNKLVTAGTIPFMFAHFNDQTSLELKETVTQLAHGGPDAFYFCTSDDGQKTFFYGLATDNKPDVLSLAKWLKSEFALAGGAKHPTLQGGGPKVDTQQLEQALRNWLSKQ